MRMRNCLLAVLLLLPLSGCGASTTQAQRSRETVRIVATIFPAYDWTREILGENPAGAQLRLLLSGGVDMHSYQPTVDDMVEISGCDLFIYVGGESDGWVADALAGAANPDMERVNLLEVLGDAARTEELVEGMQGEPEDEGAELDEHVWLSLRNARTFCAAISQALCRLDPDNEGIYQANTERYGQALEEMDGEYDREVRAAKRTTLLFADRFPFRYLLSDYGLSYYAAFAGCSAETEASFETVAFLAGKVDELHLNAVLTTESPQPRLAETVAENSRSGEQGVQILALDSMQATTLAQAQSGASYLRAMEDNLLVLRQALG